ncbi:hypothetical protein TNCT_319691 [Trichonephila clavata]|uniref:Uncharacterized protein n=1 Tax=Trichonephila clavata TaxID=2740835 RepID=A0A8X6J4I2_TRICU|nr:hypothetical protein TNCT_319691 [Trichonephila clavata]
MSITNEVDDPSIKVEDIDQSLGRDGQWRSSFPSDASRMHPRQVSEVGRRVAMTSSSGCCCFLNRQLPLLVPLICTFRFSHSIGNGDRKELSLRLRINYLFFCDVL